ncbi:MAG: glycerol-3-phosphate acyltransferase [Acidimicrobiia bacterium]|nr:glycerol-3-phosphate acyltransferase [Acidimicrobiia bacterium]
MNAGLGFLLALAGYLIGSISFARLVGRRVVPDADLGSTDLDLPGGATIEYSGVSATSIGARTGPKWGMVVGVGDMAKAFVPTLVVRLIWPDESYHLVVAVAVMLGHNYPVFYKFKGGRGQSPLYGGLLAVDWLALPVTTAIGVVVGLFLLRDMLVAYSLGQWLLIPWFALRAGPPEVAYAVAINLLYTVASVPEFRSYWRMRRSGELRQVSSWRDFKSAHPAMGTGRLDDEDG